MIGALPDDHPVDTHQDLCLALRGDTTSFTGDLLRLIAKADPGNRARLRAGFPVHVAAWEVWHAADPPVTAAELQAAAVASAALGPRAAWPGDEWPS